MTTTTFAAGTVIASTWLNDVNAIVYGSASPPANPIRVDSGTSFVGIGTTPSNLFHINGASGATLIRFSDSTPRTLGFVGSGSGIISTAAASDFGIRAEQNIVFASLGNNERVRIDINGNLLVTGPGAIGYGTGSGGTVTQLTNKNTTVTLNKTNGQIITSNSSLASNAVAAFTLLNSKIDPTDTIVWSIPNGGGTGGAYLVHFQPDNAAAAVYIRNLTGGALAEAITINFAIIKAKTS